MNNEMVFLNKVYSFFNAEELPQNEFIQKIYKDGGIECSELAVDDIVDIINGKSIKSYSEIVFAISELTAFYAAGGGLPENKTIGTNDYIKIQNQYVKKYAKDNILTFTCMMFCLLALRKCIIEDIDQADINQSLTPMLGVMHILSQWLPLHITVAFFRECFDDKLLDLAEDYC